MSQTKVLFSNGTRPFLRAGGKLRFKVEGKGKSRIWTLYGVDRRGQELQVFVTETGEPRVFRSANATINYFMWLFPDRTRFSIPLVPGTHTDVEATQPETEQL